LGRFHRLFLTGQFFSPYLEPSVNPDGNGIFRLLQMDGNILYRPALDRAQPNRLSLLIGKGLKNRESLVGIELVRYIDLPMIHCVKTGLMQLIKRLLLFLPVKIDDDIACDSEQECPLIADSLPGRQVLPNPDKCLLNDILHVLTIANLKKNKSKKRVR